MSLSHKTCIPCRVGAPTLKPPQILKFKKQLKLDWQVINHKKLKYKFKFKNFKKAIKFINQVAAIAESQGHHPNIHLTNWNQVTLELFTHKIGGLHQNDFILAAKIEKL